MRVMTEQAQAPTGSRQLPFLCHTACPAACGSNGESCSAVSRLHEALQNYYGFAGFRPGQLEVLLALVHGRDVFARMATGAGKTVYFSCSIIT